MHWPLGAQIQGRLDPTFHSTVFLHSRVINTLSNLFKHFIFLFAWLFHMPINADMTAFISLS